MSRPIKSPAYDRDNWLPDKRASTGEACPIEEGTWKSDDGKTHYRISFSFGVPDWLKERAKAMENDGSTASTLDEPAQRYLISRAKYINLFNKKHQEASLSRIIVADGMLSGDDEYAATDLMDLEFPFGGLTLDEARKDPSGEAQTRATLLLAHFKRMKNKIETEKKRPWYPPYDDLMVILQAWSVEPNEKLGLAQRLVLENPRMSQTDIERESETHKPLNFDQSCLSQWIKAGWVLDPYSHLRPGPLGTTRRGPPRKRRASSPARPGSTA